MKNILFLILSVSVFALAGCGQKGPIEVEHTQVQQEEELQDTQ